MIQIYCGDGKGKTTASVGLAVRMAGAGGKVIFSQFFKDGTSSEISVLKNMENVTVMHCDTVRGWFSQMSNEQREQAARDYADFFRRVTEGAAKADLLVLDEIAFACSCGTVPKDIVLNFLKEKPDALEVVLTGRDLSPDFFELADYVTRMEKVKHPYDRGIMAREGIEF